jgi:hypothetical protein
VALSYLFWIQVATIIQILFLAVAAFDALYFHFYKYKLHILKIAKKEQVLHTLNSILFPFTIAGFFVFQATGIYFGITLAAYFMTFAIEIFDVATEKQSRIPFGGLSALEGVLHFSMALLRALVLGIVIVAQTSEERTPSLPSWVQTAGILMTIGSIPMIVLHLVGVSRQISQKS